MESLILLTKNRPRIGLLKNLNINSIKFINMLPQVLDTTKTFHTLCENILPCCNFSMISNNEYMDLFTNISSENNDVFSLFSLLLESNIPLSIEEFQSIEFEKFLDKVQQQMLILMITKKLSVEVICLLTEKMKSVDYGEYATITIDNCCKPLYGKCRPLLVCCRYDRLDLVKLLVEKYGCDIEYVDKCDKTAIMYAADSHCIEIVKYLYDRGAKLSTQSKTIEAYWPAIAKIINTWQERSNHDSMEQEKNKYEREYNLLKSEYDVVKQKLDKVSEFVSQFDKSS